MKPKGFVKNLLGNSLMLSTVLVMSVLPHAAQAVSDTWTGTTDATWATSTNWLGGNVPGTGDTATFNDAGNGNTTLDLGAGVTLGALLFDTVNAAGYTIGSGGAGAQTLTLGSVGNAITMNSTVANNELINANLALATTGTYTVANDSTTNSLTIAGGISASTTGTKILTVQGAGNTTISGAITAGSGGMALNKRGTGTLTLSGGGALATAGGIANGNGTNLSAVLLGGTTKISSGTYTSAGEFVVGGVLTNGGAGVNTNFTMDGGTLTGSGYLSLGRGNGIGAVSSDIVLNNSAALTSANFSAGFNGGNAANLPKGTITLNNSSILTISGNGTFNLAESLGSNMTATLNGSSQIIASGTGTKYIGNQGTGSLTLNGTSTASFGGNVVTLAATQNQGSLQIGREGTGTVIMNGGTLNVSSTDLGRGVNNASAQNGTLTIKTGATYNNEGDFRMAFAGGASGQATLNMQGGTLNIGTATARTFTLGTFDGPSATVNVDSGNINLNANSSIRFNVSNNTGTKVFNLNGGAITTFSDNATTANGSGVLDMMNAASTLGAANNTFNLNGGTLAIRQVVSTQNTGTRTFNFNGGTLRATGDTAAFFNLGTGTASANVRNGGAIIDSNGFNVTIGQALVHSGIGGDNAIDGGLTKNGTGTLTLGGASTYTGATTINGGILALGAAGSIDNSSGVSLGTGGTFDVSAKVGGYSVSALSGSGSVTGALTVTSQLAIGNSPGTVNFSSNLTLGSGSTFVYEVTSGGTAADLGDVAGDLTITGSVLDVAQLGVFAANEKFTLFAYDGTLTGTFNGLADDSTFTDAGGQWLINYNDTTAGLNGGTGNSYVTITAVPEPSAALLGGLGVLALLRRRRVA